MSFSRFHPMLIVILALAFLLPVAIVAQDDTTEEEAPAGNFTVTFSGRVYDAGTDQTTFTYVVAGTGVSPDLSYFTLAIPACTVELEVVAYSPATGATLGTDPQTGIAGIKWDVPLLTTDTRTYSVTFAGDVPEGTIEAAVKGGPGFYTVAVGGPLCDEPALTVEKFVSSDGSTWVAAGAAPGLVVDLEGEVSFRFVVTNTGTSPLTDLALTDSVYDASACEVPAALEPSAQFECIIGPFPAEEGQHTNIVSASALADSEPIYAEATGNYFGGEVEETELPITIIIEGPVEAIIGNIIVIFGVNIELDPDDPILTVIQIGDILRIEGDTLSEGGTLIIIAIIVIIVEEPVVTDPGTGGDSGGDDGGWTDSGDCGNPPPPWAPAYGWRARCEGAPHPSGMGGMGNPGMGMGR